MAEPKKRLTHTRSGARRSHLFRKKIVLSRCPKCQEPIVPHLVCPLCGFYKNKDVYLVKSPPVGYVTNALMASKKGSEFWKLVFERLIYNAKNPRKWWIGKHIKVICGTGPVMLQLAYKDYRNQSLTEDPIGILPKELVLPSCCNLCTARPCQTPTGYTKILEGSSWVSYDSLVYIFFLCNVPSILFIVSMFFAIVIMYWYSK